MVILSNVEENVLKSILERYVKNEYNSVKTTYDAFPQYILGNLTNYLDMLKCKLLIASYDTTMEDIEIYLTPDGINYFNDKKKQIFPKNSMDLLQQLLEQDNPVEYMRYLFMNLDHKSDSRLRAMMRDLKEKGYIITSWADDLPFSIEFNEKAYTIDEESVGEMKNGTYIINNITNGNANINSIDNSIRNTNIINNEAEVFERMLNVASNITEENRDAVIMAIEDMKKNYNKPSTSNNK